MVEIDNTLYNYPITINDEDFENFTGIRLADELQDSKNNEQREWLQSAHENVYNLIYSVGGKAFKDRLIQSSIDALRTVIKRCLCVQLQYMLSSNGDYGKADGSNTTAEGQLVLTNNSALRSKIVAPKIYEVLSGARPNLIRGVKYE